MARPFAQIDVFTARPGWGNAVAVVLDGQGLDEVEGVAYDLAKLSLGLAAAKLPVRTRLVKRTED